MEWISAGSGLQYRKHKTRKHGVRFDRYFRGRYTVSGKTITVGFGWESEKWNQDKCHKELVALKEAAKIGQGPQTLKEKRKIEDERREIEQQAKALREKQGITFGQFFINKYLPIARSTKKPKTIEVELGCFKTWIEPAIGPRPFKDLFPLNFEKVKANMLKAGRAPRSIQLCMAIIRQAWNQARRDGLTDRECPTKEIKLPKIDNKRMRFLTHDEADRLLENLASRSQQLHDTALLSLHTGMRSGEIFSLNWGNVDIEQRIIYIIDAKSGSRTAHMTDRVKQMFKNMVAGQPDELVFKDRNGNQIGKKSHSFNRAIDALGLNNGITDSRQKVLFHTLRHTFASWLVQQGEPLYTVQKLMGHASIAMTERYSHLAPDTLKNAVRNFENGLIKNRQSSPVALHKR
jgi:integrase